jgi:tRNA1(Val) A37 N6-methylase TrmN6
VELASAVKRLLKPDGRFVLVLPERESHDFIPIAEKYHLFVHKCQQIIPMEGKEPNRVNLELRFGKPESVQVTELVMRKADNSFTEAYNDVVKPYYLG